MTRRPGPERPGELFAPAAEPARIAPAGGPLADRMRPRSLDEIVGQAHLVGAGAPLRAAIEAGRLRSAVLWGPPGTGKTTLARLAAAGSGARFVVLSATAAGVREAREVIELARAERRSGTGTILFVDEIHRFNKAQQDTFLPAVEDGTIVLIGATTENPSFEVNSALLSRAQVHVLRPLGADDLVALLRRALEDSARGLRGAAADAESLAAIARLAGGDARTALNLLEAGWEHARARGETVLTPERLREAAERSVPLYDRDGEQHYNLISAFIKSLRASDGAAAGYWMTRMLRAGEDPLFLARRLVIFASEDVGNADPHALPLAVAAQQAVHFVGLPEAEFALAQAVQYLAGTRKDDGVKRAMADAHERVERAPAAAVPLHLRNAVTPLLGGLGYGRGYDNPHTHADHRTDQPCLPDELLDKR